MADYRERFETHLMWSEPLRSGMVQCPKRPIQECSMTVDGGTSDQETLAMMEDLELKRLIKEMAAAQADISRAHMRLERVRRQRAAYLDSTRNERG